MLIDWLARCKKIFFVLVHVMAFGTWVPRPGIKPCSGSKGSQTLDGQGSPDVKAFLHPGEISSI